MSFDRLAPFYPLLERVTFGHTLQRARTAFIAHLDETRHALIAGEGNGQFLAKLLATRPSLQVTCLDTSANMLAYASQLLRKEDRDRVDLIQGDAATAQLTCSYDAIVTQFFLDCFDDLELRAVVNRLAMVAAPNARWVVAEFAIPSSAAMRLVGRTLIRTMYAFFRFTTRITGTRLLDYASLLHEHGFQRVERRTFWRGIICAELWQRG